MRLLFRHNLPYLSVIACHAGSACRIADVLIDTGSATTVLCIDALNEIGVAPRPADVIRTIRGVGGTETVFGRKLDYLRVADFAVNDFEIEVAGMDYGFGINGMDFLVLAGAVLNLHVSTIEFQSSAA